MYKSDDLPKSKTMGKANKPGRQEYHGKYELIASNEQDVLDVTTFAGKALVEHLNENDERDNIELATLYWRQTYNLQTGQLSVS
jgi:hypothetical protein